MKKIYAVFGNPVLHSKSPQIFNPAFNDLNMNAIYIRVRPQSAADISKLMKAIPIAGASITSPYKETVIKYLDNISVDAERICAVNVVVNNNGKLNGYNTDHTGVTGSLHEAVTGLAGANCLVLGGGGAARGAAYGLINHGANIYVCNRTYEKAQSIADDFGCELIDWDNFNAGISFEVVVSALLPGAIPPFFESIKTKYLLDASYKTSKVSEASKNRGISIIPGERWLIYQAAEAFKLFTHKDPSVKTMEKGLNNLPDKEDIIVKSYSVDSPVEFDGKNIDLLISSTGLDAHQQKNIIDEEICKAFGG